MQHIPNIIILPKSDVKLQRGGKHIMFMKLQKKLKLDEKHDVTFYFEDNSSKTTSLTIKKIIIICNCNYTWNKYLYFYKKKPYKLKIS